MPNPRITNFQALDAEYIYHARTMAQPDRSFLQIPLNDPSGACLDHLTLPVDPEFIIQSFLAARAQSPYDIRLWVQQYDDGTVIFTFIDDEDIPELTATDQRARDGT